MFEASKDLEVLNRTIGICKLPEKFRTAEEITILSGILSNFDIFHKLVSQEQLPEVLRAAAMNIKYMKVPMGHFLYHKDEPSRCIYFILKGEAWKFRPKTETELERESQVVKKHRAQPCKSVPKILETIRLAKASKERDLMSLNQFTKENVNESRPQSLSSIMPASHASLPSFFNHSQVLDKITDNPSLENSLDYSMTKDDNCSGKGDKQSSNDITDQSHLKMNFNTIIKKIMSKRDVLNFENDYFINVVKGSEELAVKYIKDNLNIMRFDRKICPGETVGELSMGLNYARTSSVLAYTNLYVAYLDQKGYENTFTNQIEEVREKVQFFLNYFKDIKSDMLKRMCFFFKEQRFKVGEIIYKEGSSCEDLYFIKSGEVQLQKAVETEESLVVGYERTKGNLVAFGTEPRKNMKNLIVASIVDGYFFGEEVLFQDQGRKFTAKSVSNLVCYKITSKILAKLPKEMLQMLYDFAVSKQAWRGNRLKDISNRSGSIFNMSSFMMESSNPRNSSREPESKLKLMERQSYHRLAVLDKPEKIKSPRKQKGSSLENGSKSLVEIDEQLYRFKLQPKSHQEDKNPYVLKFLPEESNAKRQTLSVWKKNVHKKEKMFIPRTSVDYRSASVPKEEQTDSIMQTKNSARPIIRDSEGKRPKLKKSNTESLLAIPKNTVQISRDDLSRYLIHNLNTKFSKDFMQKNKKMSDQQQNINQEISSTERKACEDVNQNTNSQSRDRSVGLPLNEVKPNNHKVIKTVILKDPIASHHFAVKSLNNLDNSNQMPTVKEQSFTQKANNKVNMKNKNSVATSLSHSSSLAQIFTIKRSHSKVEGF